MKRMLELVIDLWSGHAQREALLTCRQWVVRNAFEARVAHRLRLSEVLFWVLRVIDRLLDWYEAGENETLTRLEKVVNEL